jgi:hypothetical protein
LEGATVYVGNSSTGNETLCAKLGETIPENEFIQIVCEDPNGGPSNVFGAVKKEEYAGTIGDYVRFENDKYKGMGVMTICDVEVTAHVINQNVEQEIDNNLKTCEGYYQECRDIFTDPDTGEVQLENLATCYERYSFNKTA